MAFANVCMHANVWTLLAVRGQGLAALVLVAPALVALPTEVAEAAGKTGHVGVHGQSLGAAFAHGHLARHATGPPRRWVRRARCSGVRVWRHGGAS